MFEQMINKTGRDIDVRIRSLEFAGLFNSKKTSQEELLAKAEDIYQWVMKNANSEDQSQ